jgi:hypothetical protein
MDQFEVLVSVYRNEGKKQITIREGSLAFQSGFAAYLLARHKTRKLNESQDFVAYL